jgi:hypothetical protein
VPSRHRLLDIVRKAKIGGYANDFTKFAADMEIMIAHVLTFKEITSAEYIEGRIRGLGGLASAKDARYAQLLDKVMQRFECARARGQGGEGGVGGGRWQPADHLHLRPGVM